MELSHLPLVLLLISNIHSEDTEENPKANLTITPDLHVFRGESVTLRCDINAEGVSSWLYSWYKEGSDYAFSELQEYTLRSVTESNAGKYSCSGTESKGSRRSLMSDAVPLTVSAQAALSVSPQNWLTKGDSVTLICEVHGSSTGWTFNWYIITHYSDHYYFYYEPLSDSSRGAGGKYTVSSVALKHTGVYVCEAERGKPAYKTDMSNTQPLWVTGVSPPVSLVISPSRAQHFISDSLSLSCDDKSNSTGWRVRRYTDKGWMSDCSSETGSTCTVSLTTSDTGVYWCQSESGENYNPVNITVHSLSGVILESPVHPVTEGDPLTLHCLYKSTTPAKLTADFYKDGSLVQSQTSEMIITTVSKSHEGFYYCKHPEGESPKSWISVRASGSDSQISVFNILSSGLASFPYLLVTVVLIVKCLLISNIHSEDTEENPKASVRITPDLHVFRGESVTLRCDINADGVSSWRYSWYKEGSAGVFGYLREYILKVVTKSNTGKYSCIGTESKGSRRSLMSDAVPLTVSDRAQIALSVSPQNWLTEGDSVTLICEVHGSFTGWTFSWYMLTQSDNRGNYQLLSDSSRGAGGKYTVSSVALKHTGVYFCRAERGKPAYATNFSNKQPLWVTGVSPPVSLVIRPSRVQHFTSDSLSLSCEDKSNSTRWRVRRYRHSRWMSDCSSQTGSTCTISLTTSDTGVYWCQSDSRKNYNPVNITVHSGVILESPVHPVTEGDTLTLHCLYKSTTPANLTADFYKDGSLVQSQTSEMIITAVLKSHEGFYYCKRPEGESPKSWISVREV
ncbi:Fc receptor-like protein 5 [Danio aesculapii]|uniref:Fc receptor-like protein 5 n=1 Tax=Danio aesculapii TaxID=1142201 RepID=UPI0024C05EAF|nr:Fc receptor-like protein 5 [Danio aesculapii]